MSKLSDAMESLKHAADSSGHPITQQTWNDAISILTAFVSAYDAMPDVQLGCGLTNGLFLRARQFLQESA